MRLTDLLRRARRRPVVRLVGHLADDPLTVNENNVRYLVFRLVEAQDKEFRLKMFPTTPKHRRGDRVEIVFLPDGGAAVMVDSVFAAPDAEEQRRRRKEYLASLLVHRPKDKVKPGVFQRRLGRMNATPAVLGSGMEPPPSDTQALEAPATAHWRQWLRKTVPRSSGVEDPRYEAGRVCFRRPRRRRSGG